MRIATRQTVGFLRDKFPEGKRVRLVDMDDPQAPPQGTEGSVMFVDDTGTVHVKWDTGSTLGAVYGIDVISEI